MKYKLIGLGVWFLLLIGPFCLAVEYHVDTNVIVSGNGSKRAPFKTIEEAAKGLHPGDICIIHKGIYMETIYPVQSGLPGKEIIFRAATDESVVITGADPVRNVNWEQITDNIYRAKLEMNLGHENQVFLDGKMLLEARWPNSGDDLLSPTLARMDDGTTPEMIVDDQLPDLDWKGSQVWVHASKYWSNWTTSVLKHKSGQLNIENVAPYPGPNQHLAAPGSAYYIYGCLSALDTTNEWYYDLDENYLYVFSGSEKPSEDILVKRRMYAFDLTGKSNIRFEGFQLFGASVNTDSLTSDIEMNRMQFFYPYHSSQANKYYGDQTDKGVVLNGKSITIINSEIAYSSGCGVVMDGIENKLINCYIHDTDYIGTYASGIQLKGKRSVISHCTIKRSGRAVLDYQGMYQALIQYCDLSEGGMLTSDTGLTYGNVIEGGNSEVRYNFIHDNKDYHLAMGLYYDHGTQNILSHHNVVWGVDDFGLLINHYSYYHEVYNNTFSGGRIGFRSRWGNKYEPDLYGCKFYNNVFNNPCETNAGNYEWGYNLENYKGLEDNMLPSGSPGIDAGIIIDGINEKYIGESPDLGAFEYGGLAWKPGHNFELTPSRDLTRTESGFQNKVVNSAFEHEDHLFPWDTIGSVNIVHGFKNHTTPDTATMRMGKWSISLDSGAEIFQMIKGLEPNTWYEFAGFLRVSNGERAFLGIKNSNGTEWHSPSMTGNSPTWNRCILRFKTSTEQTSTVVFVRKTSDGNGKAYVDDLGLVYIRSQQ